MFQLNIHDSHKELGPQSNYTPYFWFLVQQNTLYVLPTNLVSDNGTGWGQERRLLCIYNVSAHTQWRSWSLTPISKEGCNLPSQNATQIFEVSCALQTHHPHCWRVVQTNRSCHAPEIMPPLRSGLLFKVRRCPPQFESKAALIRNSDADAFEVDG